MPTIAQRLQAEIDRANATTEKSDATVHDAVGSLIDGYGQGAGDPEQFYNAIANKEIEGVVINNGAHTILPTLFNASKKITGCYFKANPVYIGLASNVKANHTFYDSSVRCILIPHSSGGNGGGVGNYFASLCPSLKLIVLNSWGGCEGSSFQSQNIESFILSSDKLQTMGNPNIVSNSGISAGTGYVYVPDALKDSYKAATNWVKYADQIKGFSDADDYDAEKIYTIGNVCKHNGRFYAWINETDGNTEPIGEVDTYTDWYCVAEMGVGQ